MRLENFNMRNRVYQFGNYLLEKLKAIDKQYWWIKFVCITLLVVLPTLFWGRYKLSEYWSIKQRLDNLQSEIDLVQPELEKDTERLKRIREQDKAIEAIARERYLMKEAGEDIFVLKSDTNAQKKDK